MFRFQRAVKLPLRERTIMQSPRFLTKWLPTSPGRFTALNKMYRECCQADRFCCAQIQPAQANFDERLLLLVWLSSSSRGPTNRDNRNCSEGFVDSFHVTVSCAVD